MSVRSDATFSVLWPDAGLCPIATLGDQFMLGNTSWTVKSSWASWCCAAWRCFFQLTAIFTIAPLTTHGTKACRRQASSSNPPPMIQSPLQSRSNPGARRSHSSNCLSEARPLSVVPLSVAEGVHMQAASCTLPAHQQRGRTVGGINPRE